MNGSNGYAVFLYPQALEALGETIKPFLQGVEAENPHVLCREIDTGGAFVEMTLDGRDATGAEVTLELMLPGSMVRMVVSTHSDGRFGFGPRAARGATTDTGTDVPASAPVPAGPVAT